MEACLLLTLGAIFRKALESLSCCVLLACVCACVCSSKLDLEKAGLAPFGIMDKSMFTF